MHSRVFSVGLRGAEGYPVLVELDLSNGLPAFTTVGLPDAAVREARDRVSSALRNSGYRLPPRRITVNLAPAQSRKEGSHFDLPIAVALLRASGQVPGAGWPERLCFAGELALDGSLRPVPGVLAMAAEAEASGFSGMVVPEGNLAEARAGGVKVRGAANLREVAEFLAADAPLWSEAPAADAVPEERPGRQGSALGPEAEDLADVRGQALAKRALEIAAAGGHNLLLVGPPGTGKSMLARRLIGLLPPLSPAEALELARVRSAAALRGGAPGRRPFRSPHHSASLVSLIGGGPSGRPGEASLAHGGVLFLDELAEFGRAALEALRQPLEERAVSIARARESVRYPARFQLVAAVNPCPCGWRGHPRRECACAPPAVRRYAARLSGPLLDRVDLQVETAPVAFEDWAATGRPRGEGSAEARGRVLAARERQARRCGDAAALNADAPARELKASCALAREGLALLEAASRRLALTARGLDRVLRVARTIADLEGAETVGSAHLSEALQYRSLDRINQTA